jgi:predicted DNA-binding transcriptional regulator AlpA
MSTTFEHNDPLLKDVEGCAILGIAKPTWHKWVKRGLLPKPVKLGSLSRWPKSEIVAVRERAIAARSEAA